MPQERFHKQALLAKANGKRPAGRPRTTVDGPITLRILDGIVSPNEMMDVMEDREVWRLNLELLPPQTLTEKREMKKKKKSFYDTKHCFFNPMFKANFNISSDFLIYL